MIYLLGINSFIAKNIYILLKKNKQETTVLNHENIKYLNKVKNDDILINLCGVNRADNQEVYDQANYQFVRSLLSKLETFPYLIHFSSLMVLGFENKSIQELSNNQKWFIQSKLKGERHLVEHYPTDKLCIIRPSNIYGYNCQPYYNNLLTTMVYEKITGQTKINKLNKNCIRNFLSIDRVCYYILDLIENPKYGIFNLISNNTISLKGLADLLYGNKLPDHITIQDGERSVNDLQNMDIVGENVIINESLETKLVELENNMKSYLNLKKNIEIVHLPELVQPRGNMVEISALNATRLYKITLNEHSVRGNHYHFKQIEEFYTNRDRVTYLFSHCDDPDIILIYQSNQNERIKVYPYIIHTLCNDFMDNIPEIIISSTQEYIPGQTPDTEYKHNI